MAIYGNRGIRFNVDKADSGGGKSSLTATPWHSPTGGLPCSDATWWPQTFYIPGERVLSPPTSAGAGSPVVPGQTLTCWECNYGFSIGGCWANDWGDNPADLWYYQQNNPPAFPSSSYRLTWIPVGSCSGCVAGANHCCTSPSGGPSSSSGASPCFQHCPPCPTGTQGQIPSQGPPPGGECPTYTSSASCCPYKAGCNSTTGRYFRVIGWGCDGYCYKHTLILDAASVTLRPPTTIENNYQKLFWPPNSNTYGDECAGQTLLIDGIPWWFQNSKLYSLDNTGGCGAWSGPDQHNNVVHTKIQFGMGPWDATICDASAAPVGTTPPPPSSMGYCIREVRATHNCTTDAVSVVVVDQDCHDWLNLPPPSSFGVNQYNWFQEDSNCGQIVNGDKILEFKAVILDGVCNNGVCPALQNPLAGLYNNWYAYRYSGSCVCPKVSDSCSLASNLPTLAPSTLNGDNCNPLQGTFTIGDVDRMRSVSWVGLQSGATITGNWVVGARTAILNYEYLMPTAGVDVISIVVEDVCGNQAAMPLTIDVADARPCASMGACCVGATCLTGTLAACQAANGIYQGHGTNCTPDPCSSVLPTPPPGGGSSIGACCSANSCTTGTQANCATIGGVYQGHGTNCTPDPCSSALRQSPPPSPSLGACCINTACLTGTEVACSAIGGVYQGHGTDCTPDPCSSTGGGGVSSCCMGPCWKLNTTYAEKAEVKICGSSAALEKEYYYFDEYWCEELDSDVYDWVCDPNSCNKQKRKRTIRIEKAKTPSGQVCMNNPNGTFYFVVPPQLISSGGTAWPEIVLVTTDLRRTPKTITITYSFIKQGTLAGDTQGVYETCSTLKDYSDNSVSHAEFLDEITSALQEWKILFEDLYPWLTLNFQNLGDETGNNYESHAYANSYPIPNSDNVGDFRFGMHEIDGLGNTLAHGWFPWGELGVTGNVGGDVHFDPAEDWRKDTTPHTTDYAFSVKHLAAHEIGHALGLGHLSDSDALMYPYMDEEDNFHDSFLGGLVASIPDKNAVKSIYGGSP